MEKKRSFGIIFFTISVILICLWTIAYAVMDVLSWGLGIGTGVAFLITVFLIFLAVEVFKLKNWARMAWIAGSIIILILGWICLLTAWNPLHVEGLGGLAYFYPNFISIPILIFFTRAKAKEQFKKRVV